MIDHDTMRSLLKSMEQAAEESLQQDPAFYEALQALKAEIDSDPRVQSALAELRASGRRVFNSFVPHIKIRVKTEEGVFALPKPTTIQSDQTGEVTLELRNAASAVIMNSRRRQDLDMIVNEAIGANRRFEGIASQIERAGYELVICLDLSTYAQVRESAASTPRLPAPRIPEMYRPVSSAQPFDGLLSPKDMNFLKSMGVRIDVE